ncbi:hypothetical protein [Stackebrandtia soli]|uniref:hypothetical protein n=1 Tax=Stackebrandtia soli TaxID=1892856 RepID=UPI0039ECAB22
MSADYSVPSPSDKVRPMTVTVAAVASYLVTVLTIVSGIASAFVGSRIVSALRAETSDLNMDAETVAALDTMVALLLALLYIIAFTPALWALGTAICAPFVLKGRNGARVTTWVFAGLGICCGAVSLPVGGNATVDTSGDPELAEALREAMASLEIPGWLSGVQLTTAILSLLFYIAIVILLALPKSNEYFRTPKPGMPSQFLDI